MQFIDKKKKTQKFEQVPIGDGFYYEGQPHIRLNETKVYNIIDKNIIIINNPELVVEDIRKVTITFD